MCRRVYVARNSHKHAGVLEVHCCIAPYFTTGWKTFPFLIFMCKEEENNLWVEAGQIPIYIV